MIVVVREIMLQAHSFTLKNTAFKNELVLNKMNVCRSPRISIIGVFPEKKKKQTSTFYSATVKSEDSINIVTIPSYLIKNPHQVITLLVFHLLGFRVFAGTKLSCNF